MSDFRIEKDSMGEVMVPARAYYSAQTQRAFENFNISNLRFSPAFISALGRVKQTAAKVNMELGLLDEEVSKAIQRAASEVVENKLDDHFVLDIFQTGSGTSTNMNANEVISNRANELREGTDIVIHPIDHVNFGQSSNDVIPTAVRIAAVIAVKEHLIPALEHLMSVLLEKAKEYKDVVKTGRTHLMDAMPVTLKQEFEGYARQIELGILDRKSTRL